VYNLNLTWIFQGRGKEVFAMSAKKGNVQVGEHAPAFTLHAQDGAAVNLEDLLGKGWIVLYFYPKDDTPGCTTEACSFRDSYEAFKDVGAEVVGVSSDSANSHQRFAAKYHLPFLLLSDEKGAVRKLYGVPTTMGILPGRVTYVIDKEGIVRHIFNDMFNSPKHITEALRVIQSV
jgi:thioredoxin-dependent peroxiredoxin